MPSTLFNIHDSFATITRYAVESVIKELMYFTGIDQAEIIYQEILGYGKNPAANQDPASPALKLESKKYAIVNYTERFDEQVIDPLSVHQEHWAVFKNPALGVLLKPITAKANIEMNITYRTKSFDEASQWLARFQRNKIIREPGNYHNLLYNYTVPDVIMAYLYDVHKLTTMVAPYAGPPTFQEWCNEFFTKGLLTRTNLGGKNPAFAINVESKGNLGIYTSIPDSIATDKDRLVHEIEFSYRLQYDKVTDLLLEYQKIIHNQKIDPIYSQFFVRPQQPQDTHQGNRTFMGAVNTVTEVPGWYKLTIKDIFFDNEDTWLPPHPLGSTSTMFMIPIQVDTNNLRSIMSLSDIPNTRFPQMAIDIMAFFPQWITTPYNFPFLLELFAVDREVRSIPLTADVNGVIESTIDLDLRKRHYLRISLLTDLNRLPLEVIQALLLHVDWLIFIIHLINPRVPLDGLNSVLKYLGNPVRAQLESFMNLLQTGQWGLSGPGPHPYVSPPASNPWARNLIGYYVPLTVQQTNIIVNRR